MNLVSGTIKRHIRPFVHCGRTHFLVNFHGVSGEKPSILDKGEQLEARKGSQFEKGGYLDRHRPIDIFSTSFSGLYWHFRCRDQAACLNHMPGSGCACAYN